MPPLQSFFMHRAASLSTALAISVALFVLGAVPAFAATSEFVASDDDESASVQAAYERWGRFVEAAVHSSNSRLRVVLSFGGYPRPVRDGPRVDPVPLVEVVEQARGSTDPLVLAILTHRCIMTVPGPATCDAVDFARRWTVAETQNKLAWITLAALSADGGDAAGAEAAFTRSLSASLWHEYQFEIEALVQAALPETFDELERSVAFERAMSLAGVQATPFAAMSYLNRRCQRAAEEVDLAQCALTMDTIVRDTRSIMSYRLAIRFAERAGRPQAAALQRHHDAVWWAIVDANRVNEVTEFTGIREQLHGLVAVREGQSRLGDLGYGEVLLRSSGLDEAEAASRFRLQLAADRASLVPRAREPTDSPR